jgi:hypothetical protein
MGLQSARGMQLILLRARRGGSGSQTAREWTWLEVKRRRDIGSFVIFFFGSYNPSLETSMQESYSP